MKRTIFNLFSETQCIKGYSRSIIYDLPRREFHFIPNSLYEIITKYNKKSIELIFQDYKDKEIIHEYLQFLKDNELFFLSTPDESKLFPKFNIQWDYPSKITNSIIELSSYNSKYLNIIIEQLIELGCYYIQIFTTNAIPILFWSSFLDSIINSPIKSVDIFAKIKSNCEINDVEKLVTDHARLKLFYIHSSKDNGFIKNKNSNVSGKIYQTSHSVNFEKHCGIINQHYFNTNIELYSESRLHNNCLNRKICIDKNGEIKNCPAFEISFGNIKNTSLLTVLNNEDFIKYWHIRKDDIDVCKDCEFRYMCTDCRAFIQKEDDLYSQPLKCSYNPYIAKWKGEEGYISVEKWRSKKSNSCS